jgi:hypothetical protein
VEIKVDSRIAAQWGAAQLRGVQRSSVGCSAAQVGAAQLSGMQRSSEGCSAAQRAAAQLGGVRRSSGGCSAAQWDAAQLRGVQRSSEGCSAAQRGAAQQLSGGVHRSSAVRGAAQLSGGVQRSLVEGCSAAQWLVRWAAVRQPRVRFPPGTPPSAQQDELFTQQAKSNPRMNIILMYVS